MSLSEYFLAEGKKLVAIVDQFNCGHWKAFCAAIDRRRLRPEALTLLYLLEGAIARVERAEEKMALVRSDMEAAVTSDKEDPTA